MHRARHTLTQGGRAEHMLSSCRVRRDLLRLPLKASCQVQRNTHSTARSSSLVSFTASARNRVSSLYFPSHTGNFGGFWESKPIAAHTRVYFPMSETHMRVHVHHAWNFVELLVSSVVFGFSDCAEPF